jgi:hypothetical protein
MHLRSIRNGLRSIRNGRNPFTATWSPSGSPQSKRPSTREEFIPKMAARAVRITGRARRTVASMMARRRP